MTVNTTDTSTSTVADGVAVVFPFDFQTLSGGWVFAYTQDPATLVKTPRTDITVAVNADQETTPGGTATFDTAPDDLDIVVVYRVVPNTQETDYTDYDAFPAESTEDALDKLTMISQQNTAEEALPAFESPLLLENESVSTSPNPLSIRFLEGLGSTPWFLETVPFEPGRGNGLRTTTLFSSIAAQYDFHCAIVEDRGLYIAPNDPLDTDVAALATVQFVLDNAGGPGSNPTFASVTISHDTDVPANGNAVTAYTTDGLGPVVTHTFDDVTGVKSWSWTTIDTGDAEHIFGFFQNEMLLPTLLGDYATADDAAAATKEYVQSVASGGSGPFIADPGTALAASFTFDGDLGTGVWSSAAGAVNITADGLNRVTVSAFGISMNGALDMGGSVIQNVLRVTSSNGTAALPAYSFSANTNLGMYRVTTDTLGWSTASVQRMNLSALGLGMSVPIDMGGQILRSSADPTSGNQIGDRDYNDGRYALDTINMTAGTGMTGGGSLASNRTFNVIGGDGMNANANDMAVDATVVRTTGNQNVGGEKNFTGATTSFLAIEPTTIAASGDIASTTLAATGPLFSNFLGIITNTDPSDRRIKKDITRVTGSLDRLMQLIPSTFRMIEGGDDRLRHGFIAQEAGQVYPDMATKDGEGEYVTFNQNELVGCLVDAIQVLKAEIDELKSRS